MVPKIGTAGWNIPRDLAQEFPSEGSALTRYAARFGVAEINSSFHRPHRRSTWERWYASVSEGFRFSVKMPKAITHGQKLRDSAELIEDFVAQVAPLAEKLAVLLVQLPPKLEFDPSVTRAFFSLLRGRTSAQIACEPRHASWFTSEADRLLEQLSIARVGADPAICREAAIAGEWTSLSYIRLHGSPVKYRSSYHDRINLYAAQFRKEIADGRQPWCIFDNTASSAATGDALALLKATSDEEQ